MPVREVGLLLFNVELIILIENNRVRVACYFSVKNGRIGVCWMIMIIDYRIVIEKELYSK